MCTLKKDIFEPDNLPLKDENLSIKEIPSIIDRVSNSCDKNFSENIVSKEKVSLNISNCDTHSSEYSSETFSKTSSDPSSKLEENATVRTEKRRNISVARNDPPPLIHYLQDKELPKVDNDNSPPQLLPEVIVTRTKLHKEKGQSALEGTPFKISLNKNFQKLKRKSWLKYSCNGSLSDDQTSNESHENLQYTDTSQTSSSASDSKKKLSFGLLKEKGLKYCGKRYKMETSSEDLRIFHTNSDGFGNECFDWNENFVAEEGNGRLKLDTNERSRIQEIDKDSTFDMKSDIDFESWLTETEDEDEDVFITPQRVSTGKEERDTIDGIEFLGFETEHDMVEFTKIELDFQGGALQEENVTHSDDGLDMMDDSYTYSESETQTTSQAIIPTKTKDITKIKGWRTKNFAINNNPSDGQCSSNSVGPYEDDDGFVSCDIKIEEDASLDMEEQGDLWSGGEQDLFIHDDQFSLEKFPLDESLKKLDDTFVSESQTKSEEELLENMSVKPVVPENEYVEKAAEGNVESDNSVHESSRIPRYPKRHSQQSKSFGSINIKDDLNEKLIQENEPKVVKKRGRKPKTFAEKRLLLQLANQYKRKRKRGRPKGSKNKSYQQLKTSNSGSVYNLRNSSRKESEISEPVELCDEGGAHKQHANKLNVKNRSNEEFPFRELLEKAPNDTISEDNFTCSELSSTVTIKEEPIDFDLSNNITSSHNEINVNNQNSSNSIENDASFIFCSYATTTHTTNSEPIVAITNIPRNICSSVSRNISNFSTCKLSSLTCSPMPSIPVGKTKVTSSVSITTCVDRSTAHIKNVNQNNKGEGGIKQKFWNDSVVSLVNPSDKAFEYGLVLSTGIGRPVVALAMEQLKTLRKNNVNIDEHWARFAASVVTTQKYNRTSVANTVVLPVRARSLPFTSCSSNGRACAQQGIPASNRTPRLPEQKLAPTFGPSVRFRCPRPLSQVGVRTLPGVSHPKNFSHIPPIFNTSILHQKHTQEQPDTLLLQKLNVRGRKNGLLSSTYNCDDIDDEIKKVVDDIVKYVERTETNGLEILNDPDDVTRGSESSTMNGSVVTRKKKAPMIRELTRLDVNVIEMWDAKNKECTEEFCKLGCVCESLECCRPAIEEHCGKEECMFKCECEPKSYKRGDNKQHTLLSPLSLLNIPQQNRRVLAKEEKEFQQTVIRAKHETIVVGSSGSSRRKREIKLPGRYRDSYVALGKEYGLVDFRISSDEILEPPAKRQAKIMLVNKDFVKKDNINKECVSITTPKSNPLPSKVNWERKSMELKQKYEIKECYVKLEPICNMKIKNVHLGGCEELLDALTDNNIGILPNSTEAILQNPSKRSRNMAVKSTTPHPFNLHDISCHSARTAPVHAKLWRMRKDNRASYNDSSHLPSIDLVNEVHFIEKPPEACTPKVDNTFTSDLVIDNCSEGFGKIESVTSLSVEQFQKGDLGFGLEQINNDGEYSVDNEETKSATNTSPEKSGKGKISSCNLTVNKIANLLNRRMRELKGTGANDSFLSPGNDESIHLLPWPVLKSLFQAKDIQLWYYKGGSKLIITSKNLRPESSFVNLNDISPFDYKQLPSIITDLLKNGGRGRKINNPDVYALLHFDGRHVELVGTIYKNQSLSQSGNTIQNNNLKIVSGSQSIVSRHKVAMNAEENPITNNFPSNILPAFDFKNIINSINVVQTSSSANSKRTTNQIPASVSGQSKSNVNPDLPITEAKVMCKNSDFVFIAPKTLNKPPLEQNVMGLSKNFIQHTPEKLNKTVNSSTVTKDLTTSKNSEHFTTRVKKFRTVLQSTKVETASGECFPVPLPLCVVDSKWYVLSMEKAFDVLQVNKKCSVRHRHIVESIKMALKHCKTVRLPLQIPKREHENPQQPRFGVYSVPCISTFVFIGPFYLNEGASIFTYIIQRGKLVCTNELPVQESNGSLTKVVTEKHSSIVDLLKKVWLSSKQEGKSEPWLYARRRFSLPDNDTLLSKDSSLASKRCDDRVEDEIQKHPSNVSEKTHEIQKKKNSVCGEKLNELEVSIINNVQNPDIKVGNHDKIDDETATSEGDHVLFPIKITNTVSLSNPCDATSIEDSDTMKKTPSSETNDRSVTMLSSSPSSSSLRLLDQKKHSLSHLMKPTLQPVPAKINQPVPVAGWLVPSYPWIGSMRCHFDVAGGLFFLHPVSGVKMVFSNLESAQLWLDRLFQSAILYIPRQLFITWTLKLDSGEDGIQKFDTSILNGDYIMTSKGVFDIDKLIPTEAEKYGLKPIEILRLQDKKCRRDLELGFFQLRRALQEMGCENTSNRKDLMAKAIETIAETETKSRQLEKDRKRWRNIKHKSLLHLYNMMKVLPTQMKRTIVHRLKTEYDLTESSKRVSLKESDLHDGLTFSMSRYCGNTSIFGDDDGSNIDDYLSEYNEESDDSFENAVKTSTISSKDKILLPGKDQISIKGEDDDESVSISVVSSSQIENEDKPINDCDDITVTCLSDSDNSIKPVNRTLLKQVTSLKDTIVRKRKFERTDLQGTFILHSPKKSSYSSISSENVLLCRESEVIKSTTEVKKKLLNSSPTNVFEDVSKRVKTDSLQVTPVNVANFQESKNSTFDGRSVKKYSAVSIDSPKLSNDLLPNNSSIVAATEDCISALKSNKQPILNSRVNQNSTPNTLFVNVISSNQSKLVPLRVENTATSGFGALCLPVAGGTLPVSKNSLTLIQNDGKALFSKVQNDSLSVLVTNPSSPIAQTTGVLTPVKLESQRPLITVKSFAKESSSMGRDSSNFLPTLVPIIDGKLKTRIPPQKSIKTKPKSIAPMPTLIPIVDGIPADAANKKT